MKEKNVNGSACYSEHVFVRIEWGYKRVCIHDILYLEAQQDCCNIYLLKENKVSRIMVTIPIVRGIGRLGSRLFHAYPPLIRCELRAYRRDSWQHG